jgi:hypothetical protein
MLAALSILAVGCAGDEVPIVESFASLDGCANAGGPVDGQAIEVNDVLEAMADDLATLDPVSREDVRYVTLAHLHNAGASSACMSTYRAAMNLALNSVSSGLRPVAAVAVDAQETVYRIELEDHGWDAATWQRLVAGYPYRIRYDGDSWLFPFRGDLDDEIRDDTATAVPYVHGDWLVWAAMRPPLYHELLELPGTIEELEDQLGIDTAAATADERVGRTGIVRSGVSTASRMIARFALPGRGVLWTSCDVAGRGRGETILDEPVDPICESHEVVFTLRNGLPAYYATDAAGQRDRRAGGSCTGCHGATGVIARHDEVRSHALARGADDMRAILALYPPRGEMSRRFADDQRRFVQARRVAGAPDSAVDPITTVSTAHERPLGPVEAAATLGLAPDMFHQALDLGFGQVPAAAMVLRRAEGRISREAWNHAFADVVEALGLGSP